MCLTTALVHVAAILAAIYVIREGNLGEFSPSQFLMFVPDHPLIWRAGLLLTAAATVLLVAFLVASRQILDERFREASAAALAFACVAAANSLNGELSVMVLLSDLAREAHMYEGSLLHTTVQLTWTVVSQSVTQCILIGNTLFALAGLIMSTCALASARVPRWLSWLGLPVWISALNVSAMAFLGGLKLAMVLMFATSIAFVLWCTALGLALRTLPRADLPADELFP